MTELIPQLENLIGKKIPIDDEAKFDRFNDLPLEVIQSARKLKRSWAKLYIQFYITPRNWEYMIYFLEDIVYGTEDLKTWHTSIYLAASPSLNELLTKELSSIFIDHYSNLKYMRTPSRSGWNQNAMCLGSPLVFLDNIDITYESPTKLYSFSLEGDDVKLLPENSLDIIFRRWIATRIARMFYNKPEFLTFKDPEILQEYAPVSTWTNDALIAFHGLVREREEIGWGENQVPGFVAPDEFYA